MIDINWKILVVQAITFLIGLLVLWKIAYKSIVQMLADRTNKIKSDFDKAEQERVAMEKLRAEYDAKLKDIEMEVKKLIGEATESGQKTKEEIVIEAREQAQKILEKANEKISIEREKAVKEMKDEIASISISMAEKVLKQTIDKKVQEKLVDDFVNDLK